MAKRGSEIQREYAERLRKEKDKRLITQNCLWCDRQIEGPLGEMRDLYLKHLADDHPDRTTTPHRKRKNRSFVPRAVGAKTLDENIANARASGSASWAGPMDDA